MSFRSRWRVGTGRERSGSLALLLVLGLLIGACGTDAGTTSTAGGDDGGATSGGGGELTAWATRPYYVPPDDFASFEADNGVSVTYDIQSNDDILQQWLRMRDAGQTLPDILGAEDSFLIANYVEAGLVIPHDEIVAQWQEEDPDLFNALFPIVWEETAIDGVPYGASITANFDILYYDPVWLEEAGVTIPFESMDAVLEAMRAMKATRPDSIPLTVQARAGDGVTTLKTMLAAAGAPFEGAVPDLTSEGGLYVINWWLQASAEGLIPPDAIAWGEDESRGAFVSGNAGLILDGFTTAGDFAEAGDFNYPDQWNLTPVPLSQSGGSVDGVALSAARTWAVSADAEDPLLAGRTLRYIASTDNLIEAAANGSVPMRQTEALNDPRLEEIWPFFNEDLKQAYIGSTPTPAGPNAGEVEAILEQMFGEMVVGTDKTAEELAGQYQPLLDSA